MRIILSPAKKMKYDDTGIAPESKPIFLEETGEILAFLREKTPDQLRKLWACNEKIAQQNIERLEHMDLVSNLTPAILAYDGIAFTYMAPTVFETQMLDYVQKNLRILSGFYGVLKPMDGVTSYRLEMQAKAAVGGAGNLYEFWGDKLYGEVLDESRVVINLASAEYSRCIEKYLKTTDTFITCIFAEYEKDKLVQKGVYCKMARGEMVRYMAQNEIEDPEELKGFRALQYSFREELSSEKEFVFVRNKETHTL